MRDISKRAKKAVAAAFDLSPKEMDENEKSRHRVYSDARKTLIIVLYRHIGFSMSSIGQEVGVSRAYVDRVCGSEDPAIELQAETCYNHMFGTYSACEGVAERLDKLEAETLRMQMRLRSVVDLYRDVKVK